MPVHGRYTQILVDQFNLSGVSNSVQLQMPIGSLDATNFESTAQEWIATMGNGQLVHAGYLHGKTTGLEQALYNRMGTPAYVAALFGTNVVKCPAYVLQQSYAGQLTVDAPAAGVLAMDGAWRGGSGGGIKRGYRVFSGTISAIGAQAGVDFGAAGVAGGFAWLHVTAIAGTAVNATITVESASDAGFTTALATEGTFTFSAIGAQQIALSGTVNRYIRLNCTDKGGATSFAVVGIVALDGVSY